tara:strand:+ start:155 stop:415 length:261 start_codon:yes stop_codon:yes gene_type:complete
MKGIDRWSLGAGVFFLVVGLILLVYSFTVSFLLIHASVMIIIGLVILFTLKKQEYIEPIKKEKNRRNRKPSASYNGRGKKRNRTIN